MALGATPETPRPPVPSYMAHSLSSSSLQTSEQFLFPFFLHRRRAPVPGDTALETVPRGADGDCTLISGMATIMDGLTLRKQRNSFVLLFKPKSTSSADTNQPSLTGVHKPTLVYFSCLQARKANVLHEGSQIPSC